MDMQKALKNPYVLYSGLFFHAFAGAFVIVLSAYAFRDVNQILIPIAGTIVSFDHASAVYKLFQKIKGDSAL